MDLVSIGEFEPRTVDKVERLLDLLEELERHPGLKGTLALHGGTAINLFMLGIPLLYNCGIYDDRWVRESDPQ